MYDFTFDPLQLLHIRPIFVTMHLVAICIICALNSIYPLHTQETEKSFKFKAIFELSVGTGGLPTVWCYTSKLESFSVNLKENT